MMIQATFSFEMYFHSFYLLNASFFISINASFFVSNLFAMILRLLSSTTSSLHSAMGKVSKVHKHFFHFVRLFVCLRLVSMLLCKLMKILSHLRDHRVLFGVNDKKAWKCIHALMSHRHLHFMLSFFCRRRQNEKSFHLFKTFISKWVKEAGKIYRE